MGIWSWIPHFELKKKLFLNYNTGKHFFNIDLKFSEEEFFSLTFRKCMGIKFQVNLFLIAKYKKKSFLIIIFTF